MIHHLSLGTNDVARSRKFYDAVLGVLGLSLLKTSGGSADYGVTTVLFSLETPVNGKPATAGNGVHIAFEAGGRSKVDEFHRVALLHGGSGLEALRNPPGHDAGKALPLGTVADSSPADLHPRRAANRRAPSRFPGHVPQAIGDAGQPTWQGELGSRSQSEPSAIKSDQLREFEALRSGQLDRDSRSSLIVKEVFDGRDDILECHRAQRSRVRHNRQDWKAREPADESTGTVDRCAQYNRSTKVTQSRSLRERTSSPAYFVAKNFDGLARTTPMAEK